MARSGYFIDVTLKDIAQIVRCLTGSVLLEAVEGAVPVILVTGCSFAVYGHSCVSPQLIPCNAST